MRARITITLAATFALAGPALAQDIGVPACDKFLKTFETCVIAKAAPQTQTQMKTTFQQMRANWQQVAASADGKKSLEAVCQSTTEQVKSQMAPLNCAW